MRVLLRKVLGSALGVLLCIAIWSIQDRLRGGRPESDSSNSIPSEVWGGGGGVVTIEAECSEPAILAASFESNAPIDDDEHQYLETWQEIQAGRHVFEIAVPSDVSGAIDLRVDEPHVGAKIKLRVLVDGESVSEESMRLDQPLQAGYGFSTGIALDDYASGRLSED